MRPGVLALYLPLFTNLLEGLSEKGASNAPIVDLAGLRREKWTEKPLCGDLQGYAASASEAFRTVSEGEFCELRLECVLRSSCTDEANVRPSNGAPVPKRSVALEPHSQQTQDTSWPSAALRPGQAE